MWFIIGSAITAVVFIVWGIKNQTKISAARTFLIDNSHKLEVGVKAELSKIFKINL